MTGLLLNLEVECEKSRLVLVLDQYNSRNVYIYEAKR